MPEYIQEPRNATNWHHQIQSQNKNGHVNIAKKQQIQMIEQT